MELADDINGCCDACGEGTEYVDFMSGGCTCQVKGEVNIVSTVSYQKTFYLQTDEGPTLTESEGYDADVCIDMTTTSEGPTTSPGPGGSGPSNMPAYGYYWVGLTL